MAVTRGMALCVVVGQPYLLYLDRCWRQLLTYCHTNGTIIIVFHLLHILSALSLSE